MRSGHPFRPQRIGSQQYRLYFLDSVDRLISRVFEFEASHDAAAIELAEAYREGRPAELWCGDRKLKGWPNPGPSD